MIKSIVVFYSFTTRVICAGLLCVCVTLSVQGEQKGEAQYAQKGEFSPGPILANNEEYSQKLARVSEDGVSGPQKKSFVDRANFKQVRKLDPTVFTSIRPFTLDSNPVKLPEDQLIQE